MKIYLLVLLNLLLTTEIFAATYTMKIESKNLTNSSIKIESAETFTLSCVEGVLNEEEKTCTITETITRVESCPSGYVDKGDGTCENTTTASQIKYCPSGYDIGSGCRVTNYATVSYRCPSSHPRDLDGNCYSFATSYVDFQNPCRAGYRSESNRCYLASDLGVRGYYCPSSSYTQSGNNCYKDSTVGYSYTCPNGFSLSGSSCLRVLSVNKEPTSCPSDYIEVNSELCEKTRVEPAIQIKN